MRHDCCHQVCHTAVLVRCDVYLYRCDVAIHARNVKGFSLAPWNSHGGVIGVLSIGTAVPSDDGGNAKCGKGDEVAF